MDVSGVSPLKGLKSAGAGDYNYCGTPPGVGSLGPRSLPTATARNASCPKATVNALTAHQVDLVVASQCHLLVRLRLRPQLQWNHPSYTGPDQTGCAVNASRMSLLNTSSPGWRNRSLRDEAKVVIEATEV